MTLVDTSVWIEGFRGSRRASGLEDLLEKNEILLHPWVLGELSLGSLGSQLDMVTADLKRLPTASVVPHEEVLQMVSIRELAGRGTGWVDVHLLASALVAGSKLWTLDRALAAVAEEFGLVRN